MSRYFKEIRRLIYLRLTSSEYWVSRISNRQRSKAVFSMSVLPSRFKGLLPTLNSLTDQSVLPNKIIINLPKYFKRDKTEYEIPEYVLNHPLIFINWIEEDMGPATKLLPTIDYFKNDPDQLIIIVDDDQIYPKDLVSTYVNMEEKLPDCNIYH